MPSWQSSPILVTGTHRSGTRWVGEMLATSPSLGYVHEPFNIDHRSPGICSAPFPHHFEYVTADNEHRYIEPYARTLAFRYDIGAALHAARSVHELRARLAEWATFRHHRRAGLRPLVKDPISVLSADWIAHRFGAEVVVLIRHPAGFAASLKRLGWEYDFRNLLDQPAFLEQRAPAFRDEVADFASRRRDIVSQAALLWRILNSVVLQYRSAHPDWTFLRYEDVCADPIAAFADLFRRLNLPGWEKARPEVERTSYAPAASPPAHRADIYRDSRSMPRAWTTLLSEGETAFLRAATEDVWTQLYDPADWEPAVIS